MARRNIVYVAIDVVEQDLVGLEVKHPYEPNTTAANSESVLFAF